MANPEFENIEAQKDARGCEQQPAAPFSFFEKRLRLALLRLGKPGHARLLQKITNKLLDAPLVAEWA
jgi:hypothetical protein